jgi:hypothetical protein
MVKIIVAEDDDHDHQENENERGPVGVDSRVRLQG